MAEVISLKNLSSLIKDLQGKGSKVLVGGCFDVLHPGHVIFLEKAKKAGNYLIVLLESDQKVKALKGVSRPVHSQKERAQVLSALSFIDYIVLLPFMRSDREYDNLIAKIRPDIIAATKGDKNASYHQRSAKQVGASFKFVTNMIGDHSTSGILNHQD